MDRGPEFLLDVADEEDRVGEVGGWRGGGHVGWWVVGMVDEYL